MKKFLAIILVLPFLLAGHRASGQERLSVLHTDSCQCDCGSLYAWGRILSGEGSSGEPMGYDTLKLFLQQCPFYGDSGDVIGPNNSWRAFSDIYGAVDAWSQGGQGRYADFLSLLKQVLYNNPDTNWYCEDVSDMLNATQDVHANMAILQYIVQSGKCPEFTASFQKGLAGDKQLLHKKWLDSLQTAFLEKEDSLGLEGEYFWPDSIGPDTLAHPFTDTVVPTLWQDSLQILLGPQYAGVSSPSPITFTALLSAQLMENPTETNEIGVSYQMGRTALVTMQLLDILGRTVPIADAKYQLQQSGTHEATIPVPTLPAGTYYLRISTDAGDAITLKLVKQ
jgi:hypothetical protein